MHSKMLSSAAATAAIAAIATIATMTDRALWTEIERLARSERQTTAALIAHLAELEARRLYLDAGFGSLFDYCRQQLRFSESETYNRIAAAEAARRFPVILDLLAAGSVNLTTIRLLAPKLTRDNFEALLSEAAGKRKREVLEILAREFPRPPVPDSIRKEPTQRIAAPPTPASTPEATAAETEPPARASDSLPAPAVPPPPAPRQDRRGPAGAQPVRVSLHGDRGAAGSGRAGG